MRYLNLNIYITVEAARTLIGLTFVAASSFIINSVMARKRKSAAAKAALAKAADARPVETDSRPENSPYGSPACTIPFASPLTVPLDILKKSPRLQAAYESRLPELPAIPEGVGHVLVHYLHTGTYESLRPVPTSTMSKQICELKTSIQSYAAARAFDLPDLMRLAEAKIDKYGEGLPLPALLEVARDAYPTLTEGDGWFLDYLRSHIRPHLRDPKSLLGSNMLDQISGILSPHRVLLRTVLELFCERIVVRPEPVVSPPLAGPVTSPGGSRPPVSPFPPLSPSSLLEMRPRAVVREGFPTTRKKATPWPSPDAMSEASWSQETSPEPLLSEVAPPQFEAKPAPMPEPQPRPFTGLGPAILDIAPSRGPVIGAKAVMEPEVETAPEPELKTAIEPATKAAVTPEVEAAPEPELTTAIEPEIKADVEPATKAVVVAELTTAAEPETKGAAAPEVKATHKPEPTTAAKPETKGAAAPEVKATHKPEPTTVTKPETKATVAPEVEAAPEPEPKTAAEPETKAAVVAEVKTTPKPEPMTVTKPETKATVAPEVEAAPEPEPKTAIEPETKAAVVAEVKTTPEPGLTTAAEPETKGAITSKVKTTPEPELTTAIEPETKTVAVPELEATVAPKVKKEEEPAQDVIPVQRERKDSGKGIDLEPFPKEVDSVPKLLSELETESIPHPQIQRRILREVDSGFWENPAEVEPAKELAPSVVEIDPTPVQVPASELAHELDTAAQPKEILSIDTRHFADVVADASAGANTKSNKDTTADSELEVPEKSVSVRPPAQDSAPESVAEVVPKAGLESIPEPEPLPITSVEKVAKIPADAGKPELVLKATPVEALPEKVQSKEVEAQPETEKVQQETVGSEAVAKPEPEPKAESPEPVHLSDDAQPAGSSQSKEAQPVIEPEPKPSGKPEVQGVDAAAATTDAATDATTDAPVAKSPEVLSAKPAPEREGTKAESDSADVQPCSAQMRQRSWKRRFLSLRYPAGALFGRGM